MAYDIGQVTDMFDALSNKVISELDSQFTKGRIKGTDYANAYASLLGTIIQASIDVPVKDKQIDLQKAQIDLYGAQKEQAENDIAVKNKQLELQELQTNKDIEIKDKQIALQEKQVNKDIAVKDRQIQGFDDKIRTDLFKTQMDTWGMMFASGMLDKKPDIITNDETSTLYNTIKSKLR